MTTDDIEARFTYHQPDEAMVKALKAVRDTGRLLAYVINANAPEGRAKSLAVTKLEEAVMWANKAIVMKEAGDESTHHGGISGSPEASQGAGGNTPDAPQPSHRG